MSRFKRVAGGALWAGLGFVAAAFATLWATPKVVGGLGLDSYGVFGLLLGAQGALLLVLSNPGQLAALVMLAGNDEAELERKSRALSAWSILAAGLALGVAWLLSNGWLAFMIWKDPLRHYEWVSVLPWAGLGWACQLLVQALWAAQRARHRQALAEMQQAVVGVVVILLAPLAVSRALGLEGLVQYQTLAWLGALILGLVLEAYFGTGLKLLPKDDRPTFAEIRRLAGWTLLAAAGGAVLLYADRLFSLRAGARELAAWSLAIALSLRVSAGLGLLGPLLLPQLSELRSDPTRWGHLQSLYLRLNGLAALAFYLPLAAGGASLLGAWVGPEVQQLAEPWIVLLSLSGFLLCLSNAYFAILMGMDGAKQAAHSALGAAAVGLICGAVAQGLHLPGAAWMALGGQATAMLWRSWVLQRQGLGRVHLGAVLQSLIWVLPAALLLPLLRWAAFPRWFGERLLGQAGAFALLGALLLLAGLALDDVTSKRRGRLSLWSQLRRLGPNAT